MLTIRTLTPLQSGYGQQSGAIDQPVVREPFTNWPYLNGERIKGVLRDACDAGILYKSMANGEAIDNSGDPLFRLFGPPTSNASDFAGALIVSDAVLLCYPVRSFFGTFAWITCPLALQRWKDDCFAIGDRAPIRIPTKQPGSSSIYVPHGPLALVGPDGLAKVFLEEYQLTPVRARAEDDFVAGLVALIADRAFPGDAGWAERFKLRFGIVSDDLFTRLVELMTVRSARIRLDPKSKTVAQGALWYEESIPPQAIFSLPLRLKGTTPWTLLEQKTATPIQIGGNRSVGSGFARFHLAAVKGDTA
jgi:CRISPR-associated protein Cmr4